MDIADMYRNLDYIQSQITAKKIQLETSKKNNERAESVKKNFEYINDLERDLTSYVKNLDVFSKLVEVETSNYKQRRIDFLSNYIENNIATIFPKEGYKARIKIDPRYNKQHAHLELISRNGYVGVPHMNSGKLLQELISFSSAIAIAECLGKNKFYMDEAFAASSPENLTKVGLLLKKLVDENFQILLIEQKDDIYKDIPRREIHIAKDELNDEVKVLETLDY